MKKPLIFLAALVAPVAAQAGSIDVTPSSRVSYADLNLSSAADQQILQTRIEAAVREVCLAPSGLSNLSEFQQWHSCRDRARAQVQEQLPANFALASGRDRL